MRQNNVVKAIIPFVSLEAIEEPSHKFLGRISADGFLVDRRFVEVVNTKSVASLCSTNSASLAVRERCVPFFVTYAKSACNIGTNKIGFVFKFQLVCNGSSVLCCFTIIYNLNFSLFYIDKNE
jgi:hypothetical protein